MYQDYPTNLLSIAQFAQNDGIIIKKENETFVPLRLCYYPFITSQQMYHELGQVTKILQKLIIISFKDKQFVTKTFEHLMQGDETIKRILPIYEKSIEQNKKNDLENFMIFRGEYFLNESKKFKLIKYNLIDANLSNFSQKYHNLRKSMNVDQQLTFSSNLPDQQIGSIICDYYKNQRYQGIFLIPICQGQCNLLQQSGIMLQFLTRCIRSKRVSFFDLSKKLNVVNKKLYLGQQLVSIVYYKTGYTSSQFYANQIDQNACWEVIQMIELSDTLKIPNITMNLMNQKRMQAKLFKPQIYSKYLDPEQCKFIQPFLVNCWDFGGKQQQNQKMIEMISQKGQDKFILKTKLKEGNNLQGQNMMKFIKNSSIEQLQRYILMEKVIRQAKPNIFFQGNIINKYEQCLYQVSRYGVISYCQKELLKNVSCGYLVKAKAINFNQAFIMKSPEALGFWTFGQI